jgi:hypothetical protein
VLVFVEINLYVPLGSVAVFPWLKVTGTEMRLPSGLRTWKVQPVLEGFTVADGLLQFRLMLSQLTGQVVKSLATVNVQESKQPDAVLVEISL